MLCLLVFLIGGDLFDAITRVTRFPESEARIMIRHLASAMAYLHSLSIVHRDIKPENLLVELDEDGRVTQLKLADFGLACEVTEPLTAVCGTPTYVAPEILMETGYGLKVKTAFFSSNRFEHLRIFSFQNPYRLTCGQLGLSCTYYYAVFHHLCHPTMNKNHCSMQSYPGFMNSQNHTGATSAKVYVI